MKGLLVLENGARFKGELLGEAEGIGELVFNTGMTGYQECFTDPSYAVSYTHLRAHETS